ncbi:MAG: phosphatidylglycerophosphatase A [Pseudomonadota bacterium]
MRLSTAIASVFGIGYFKIAPGTVMSAVAMPLAFLIARHGGGAALLAASIAVFVIGIYACGDHVRATGREDPSECVIDELAGQWLACAFAVAPIAAAGDVISLPALALAFVFFRLFDIWKPWPVSWADQKIAGGFGVMADDMLAGLMAGLVVILIRVMVPL